MTGMKEGKGLGKSVAEHAVGLIVGLAATILLFELGSRLASDDPTIAVYDAAKCQVSLSLAQRKLNSLDERIADLDAELEQTRAEIAAADKREQEQFTATSDGQKNRRALAAAICDRDRLDAHRDEIVHLRATLVRAREGTQAYIRDLKIRLARCEAKVNAP